jgi:hypothetical protein
MTKICVFYAMLVAVATVPSSARQPYLFTLSSKDDVVLLGRGTLDLSDPTAPVARFELTNRSGRDLSMSEIWFHSGRVISTGGEGKTPSSGWDCGRMGSGKAPAGEPSMQVSSGATVLATLHLRDNCDPRVGVEGFFVFVEEAGSERYGKGFWRRPPEDSGLLLRRALRDPR